MELFDLAQAWGWQDPEVMILTLGKEKLAAMLAHARLRNVMTAIQYEDNRPKDGKS